MASLEVRLNLPKLHVMKRIQLLRIFIADVYKDTFILSSKISFSVPACSLWFISLFISQRRKPPPASIILSVCLTSLVFGQRSPSLHSSIVVCFPFFLPSSSDRTHGTVLFCSFGRLFFSPSYSVNDKGDIENASALEGANRQNKTFTQPGLSLLHQNYPSGGFSLPTF